MLDVKVKKMNGRAYLDFVRLTPEQNDLLKGGKWEHKEKELNNLHIRRMRPVENYNAELAGKIQDLEFMNVGLALMDAKTFTKNYYADLLDLKAILPTVDVDGVIGKGLEYTTSGAPVEDAVANVISKAIKQLNAIMITPDCIWEEYTDIEADGTYSFNETGL